MRYADEDECDPLAPPPAIDYAWAAALEPDADDAAVQSALNALGVLMEQQPDNDDDDDDDVAMEDVESPPQRGYGDGRLTAVKIYEPTYEQPKYVGDHPSDEDDDDEQDGKRRVDIDRCDYCEERLEDEGYSPPGPDCSACAGNPRFYPESAQRVLCNHFDVPRPWLEEVFCSRECAVAWAKYTIGDPLYSVLHILIGQDVEPVASPEDLMIYKLGGMNLRGGRTNKTYKEGEQNMDIDEEGQDE